MREKASSRTTASNSTSPRRRAASKTSVTPGSREQALISPAVRAGQPSANAPDMPTEQIAEDTSGGRWRAIWQWLRSSHPTLFSRLAVSAVFLMAGVSKALDRPAFAAEISAYRLAPTLLVQPIALALPLLEILIGVYLLLGFMQRWSAGAAAVLLIGFIGAMALTLARGLTLDCGCFGNTLGVGILRETVGPSSIARDVFFLALAVHLIMVPGIWSVDWLRSRRAKALALARRR